MSTQTMVFALNANEPEFLKSLRDVEQGITSECDHAAEFSGTPENNPGAEVLHDEGAIRETDDEYGGWVVDLSKLPASATHIKIING